MCCFFFNVNWTSCLLSRIEKEIRSVTSRKRRYTHAEYTQLGHDCRKVDMLLELKSYNIELLSLEVGNTDMGYDETKESVDRSALTIQLKDTYEARAAKAEA